MNNYKITGETLIIENDTLTLSQLKSVIDYLEKNNIKKVKILTNQFVAEPYTL